MNILTINLLFSTFVFWLAAKIYLLPRLQELKPRSVLLPILLLHAFRHLGLMFLAPGATYAGIPRQFAYPAASGTCSPLFWLWSRSRHWQLMPEARVLWSGSSTSKGAWT